MKLYRYDYSRLNYETFLRGKFHTTGNIISRSVGKEWGELLAFSNEKHQQRNRDGNDDNNTPSTTTTTMMTMTTTRSMMDNETTDVDNKNGSSFSLPSAVAVGTEQLMHLLLLWPIIRRTIPYIKTFF